MKPCAGGRDLPGPPDLQLQRPEMTENVPEADLSKLDRRPLSERDNLVSTEDFCSLVAPEDSVSTLLDSLPSILAADDLRDVCRETAAAVERDALVGMGFGAHVIKTGCSPVLIDLIERGVLGCLTLHGAGAIHDYELALIGETSEDVQDQIEDGRFGMWEETASGFADACARAEQEEIGLGAAYGEVILNHPDMDEDVSVLATCRKHDVPATIHLALGTDIVHMHPDVVPEAAGDATMRDFRILSEVIQQLQHGVWFNVGSAVLLPEVFLKVVSVARNLGADLDDFLAVNFDMIQHYRPHQNVIGRPAPRGIAITGHHEILLPLFRAGVLEHLSES